jgi:hypothetical protein
MAEPSAGSPGESQGRRRLLHYDQQAARGGRRSGRPRWPRGEWPSPDLLEVGQCAVASIDASVLHSAAAEIALIEAEARIKRSPAL